MNRWIRLAVLLFFGISLTSIAAGAETAASDSMPASPAEETTPTPAPTPSYYAGPETCSVCHEAEYEEWESSKHGQAFSPTFHMYWEESDKNKDCLACHTTGFNKTDGTFFAKGVQCESCHEMFNDAHPDTKKMFLPTDVEVCKRCHQNTYREWKLSAHADNDIRCFDCHQAHKQGLRQRNVELHCGACHPQKLEDFVHATHSFQGLTCATCHMAHSKTAGKIGGTGAPSHSFFVGAETCAACHEEMVHKSHKIPTLAKEVEDLTQSADVKLVKELRGDISRLELDVDMQKARTVRYSIGALIIGLFFGALFALLNLRRGKGNKKS